MPSRLKARHHLRSNGNIRAGASVGTKRTIGIAPTTSYAHLLTPISCRDGRKPATHYAAVKMLKLIEDVPG